MRIYNYRQIETINESCIIFKDGYTVDFTECRENWAKEKGISPEDSLCIAERDITENDPSFIFYSNEKTKICFSDTIGFIKIKKEKEFLDMQRKITGLGYSSYDNS